MLFNQLNYLFDLRLHYYALFIIFLLIVYNSVFKTWRYFDDQNIKYIRGVPLFGVLLNIFIRRKPIVTTLTNIYNKYPNEKVIGIYEMGGLPIYFIRDPNIIKNIFIKDYDYFVNRRSIIDDPTLGKSMYFIKNFKWKEMRTILSPAFTVDKMREMLFLIDDLSEGFFQSLSEIVEDKSFVLELRDLFSRYASFTFGIQIESMTNFEFLKNGKRLVSSSLKAFKFFGHMSWPKLIKVLNSKIVGAERTDFFRTFIRGAFQYCYQGTNDESHYMYRKYLLSESGVWIQKFDKWFADAQEAIIRKNKTKKYENDLIAQCIIFFFAGLDTTSTLLTFMGHELAVNPTIQDKLYQEILDTKLNLRNKPITYEILNKMKYMDMIVCETLRKWNPTVLCDRQVCKPYSLKLSDNHIIQLNIGDIITIPTCCIQLDEKYFPNPYRFDLERFSAQNIGNIQPGTYMPFGLGPRNCIGSKFALMICKSIFYHSILKFKFEPSDKTQIPLKLKTNTLNMLAENGFWIKLKPRELV